MSKLYIFGIGGTGSRVLRSLTMLLASGVQCNDTIVPIIIDKDIANGDYTRTNSLIKSYMEVNKYAPKHDASGNIENTFFNTDIELLDGNLLLQLNDSTKLFKDFIGLNTQNKQNQALSKMLYSDETLNMDTTHGFRGNPNMGSVVLNQFSDTDIFKSFANSFQQGDRIIIISSIFGGTGASGFPLLRQTLQTPNVSDSKGNTLPNWGLINNAPIGAITVLPYFQVDKKDSVDSDTFNDKAKAALSYYQTQEDGKIDTLYYIADDNRKSYKYFEGGNNQRNDAHFVEMAAAMAILDFVNPQQQSVNINRDQNNQITRTTYKEFGIGSNAKNINFGHLSSITQELLINPLSRFMLFAKYMGNVKNDKDVFKKQSPYQPYALEKCGKKNYDKNFRKEISELEKMQKHFTDWLSEMAGQARSFSPFNLENKKAFEYVDSQINLFDNSKSPYSNWAKFDNELNRQINKIEKSLKDKNKDKERFIELFYRATKEIVNFSGSSTDTKQGSTNYIFRLQTGGDVGLSNTISHWGVSQIYDDALIKAIPSSNIKSDKQPTSIPSPFARIALVKTAFAEVASNGKEALKAYQKAVSDSLDIAEIFFNYSKYKNLVDIITWSRDADLSQLQAGHNILYRTLNTFLNDGSSSYNFDQLNGIYILQYKPTGQIIGATSPSTLFFSTENDYNAKDNNGNIINPIDIQLSNNKLAFSGISDLNSRSWEFQEYLHTWNAANNVQINHNGTSRLVFNEFHSYLQSQINELAQIQDPRVATINSIYSNQNIASQNLTSNYNRISGYEILSRLIYEQRPMPVVSDFRIQTTIDGASSALVLPLEGGAGSVYVNWNLTQNTKWNNYKANEAGDRGVLPDGTQENWFTRSDFLEDKIIRIPSRTHTGNFIMGDKEVKNDTFLLPIKDLYFKFFNPQDLAQNIDISADSKTVVVTLRVPVQNGEVEFKKTYKKSDFSLIDLNQYDFALYPNVKFNDEKDAFYRFAMFYPFDELNSHNVEFFNGDKLVSLSVNDKIVRNQNDKTNAKCSTFSINQKIFDNIRIKIGDAQGVLVPNLSISNANEVFTFAVDFGTTNTHIEYRTNIDANIKAFDIGSNDNDYHMRFSHDKYDINELIQNVDFVPEIMGASSKTEFSFPLRTALSVSKNRPKNVEYDPFLQVNPILSYEKRIVPNYNDVLTQLKWDASEEEMGYYIDSLCFIMRNKVILNDGDLCKTKIAWFYPQSMAGSRSNIIRNKWKIGYAKYFLGESVSDASELSGNAKQIIAKNIKDLPESIAPYLNYKNDPKYKYAISNLVSIDIGGGTTDTVFVNNDKIEYVTSFRFASNSVFGIGKNISPIISKYEGEIEEVIKNNDDDCYTHTLENILNSIKNSEFGDLASFFFSLDSNFYLKERNVKIGFSEILRKNKDQKIVFVIFFVAIIYHTAQIMKSKEMPLPRHVAFSGKGSKILNIIADTEVLEGLTKTVFEHVYKQKYGDSGLTIIRNERTPKEVTCKGGVTLFADGFSLDKFTSLVLRGDKSHTFVKTTEKYSDIEIDKSVKNINEEVLSFLNYVVNDLLHQNFANSIIFGETFINSLSLNPKTLNIVKDELEKQQDLDTYTRKGIEDKIKSIGDPESTTIEETFFFYPIEKLLNAISREIEKK